MKLVADKPANTLRLDLQQGRAEASAWLPLDQPSHAQIVVKNLPATWLRGLLSTVGSAQTSGGLVNADLSLVDGETHVEAVISRPARYLVMKAGKVVATNGECLV